MAAEYVVAVTGASGAPYAVALLRALRRLGASTHLILSPTATAVLPYETGLTVDEVAALADRRHDPADLFSVLASGSYAWRLGGMAIVPCSMKTLAAVAHGYADNLIARAADVMLKERRRLVLVPRETPLSVLHLRNLLAVAEAGAVVLPPMPAFYSRPRTLDDLVEQTVQRIVVHLGLPADPAAGWQGLPPPTGDE
ncbi:MAG: UbiX family flavin prenyltransferase [Chloroflexota bacterium]